MLLILGNKMSDGAPGRDRLSFFRPSSNPNQRGVVFKGPGSASKVDEAKSTKELCGNYSATARTTDNLFSACENNATSKEQLAYFREYRSLVKDTTGKVNTLNDPTLAQKASVTSSSTMYNSGEAAGKDSVSVIPGASKGVGG